MTSATIRQDKEDFFLDVPKTSQNDFKEGSKIVGPDTKGEVKKLPATIQLNSQDRKSCIKFVNPKPKEEKKKE